MNKKCGNCGCYSDKCKDPRNANYGKFRDKGDRCSGYGMQIKQTLIPYCQACGTTFAHLDIVYYAPLDGNIVCAECSRGKEDGEIRVFVGEVE
ncbi:MAG: hypothetical protein WC749_02250 [Dehalococcoidia bacterium]